MWIPIALVSYLIFAGVALIDKHLLAGPLQNPKTYAFYIGMLVGGVAFVLIPFGLLEAPGFFIISVALFAGAMRTTALVALFSGLRNFEASRIIPALGGAIPIFMVVFTVLITGEKEILSPGNFIAFTLLVVGTIAVSVEKHALVTLKSLRYSLLAAFFLAAFFVLSKVVYTEQSFISGLIWLSMGAFLSSLLLLGFRQVRKEVFERKKAPSGKVGLLFVGNQAMAGVGAVLQNFAIALTPFGLLAFVGALGGTQYVFLFLLVVFVSIKYPQFLREKITRKVVIQKGISIALIGAGLIVLAL